MKECLIVCAKGDGLVNEDACGHSGQFAWVIDGATDVFNKNSIYDETEVSTYVAYLNRSLGELANQYQPSQLDQLVKDAVESVYNDLNINDKACQTPEYMLPTFAIALVAADAETLYYFILGDCFVCYPSEKGFKLITDNRISSFSKHNREILKSYYEKHHQMPSSLAIYQETRCKANAPDGYPIGSVRGGGLSHALTGTFHLSVGKPFIICSDGFLDYFRSNGAKKANFFSMNTIYSEIASMYSYLSDEKQFFTELRPKKLDDHTLMLLEV